MPRLAPAALLLVALLTGAAISAHASSMSDVTGRTRRWLLKETSVCNGPLPGAWNTPGDLIAAVAADSFCACCSKCRTQNSGCARFTYTTGGRCRLYRNGNGNSQRNAEQEGAMSGYVTSAKAADNPMTCANADNSVCGNHPVPSPSPVPKPPSCPKPRPDKKPTFVTLPTEVGNAYITYTSQQATRRAAEAYCKACGFGSAGVVAGFTSPCGGKLVAIIECVPEGGQRFKRDKDGNIGVGNSGSNNIGYGNVGNSNLGSYNRGSYNVGESNRGSYQVGYRNMGAFNCGSNNAGSGNTGNNNAGHNNSGSSNAGSGNTGAHNVGAGQTGAGSVGGGARSMFLI